MNTTKKQVEPFFSPDGGGIEIKYYCHSRPDCIDQPPREIIAIREVGNWGNLILPHSETNDEVACILRRAVRDILAACNKNEAQNYPRSEEKVRKFRSDPSREKIILVCGPDESLRAQAARLLEKLGFDVVVLVEERGKGRTLIEKLEGRSDITRAVVLLTPDDFGRSNKEKENDQPRARQNVILELGYFLGKLGRGKVFVVRDESVDLPSDYRGVECIELDSGGMWKLKLTEELKDTG